MMLRLREHGIVHKPLLDAIESIPRPQFIRSAHVHRAWADRSLPLANGQTMPPPSLTHRLVAALQVEAHHSVLEMGTGSGYQTAILARLSRKVRTVDRYASLLAQARKVIEALEIDNVTFHQADALTGEGRGGGTLYDRIVTDLAFDDLPRDLLDQLASGGKVVAPIGPPGGVQTVVRLTKVGSRFQREALFDARFGQFDSGVATVR
ncbi:methyltransferase domain-containing protein [Rhizobiaceae bacterium]|nr:methyltransferase domain-containing protein [Rhizobiaceae bacterium]